jgi:biopolymer transport protein TolR
MDVAAHRRRRNRRMMNQINVVPYIDVMLVLLVIFMVTAPLVSPGQIDLPVVGQALTAPVAPVQVTIRADRSLAVLERARGAEERRVTRDELVGLLRAMQAKNPDQPVVIAGDRKVPYEAVLDVMDLLQQSGIRRVGLLARQR